MAGEFRVEAQSLSESRKGSPSCRASVGGFRFSFPALMLALSSLAQTVATVARARTFATIRAIIRSTLPAYERAADRVAAKTVDDRVPYDPNKITKAFQPGPGQIPLKISEPASRLGVMDQYGSDRDIQHTVTFAQRGRFSGDDFTFHNRAVNRQHFKPENVTVDRGGKLVVGESGDGRVSTFQRGTQHRVKRLDDFAGDLRAWGVTSGGRRGWCGGLRHSYPCVSPTLAQRALFKLGAGKNRCFFA